MKVEPVEVPKRGRHYPTPPDGRLRPSVTNINEAMAKAGLGWWMANEERKLVIGEAAELNQELQEVGSKLTTEMYIKLLEGRLGAAKAHQKKSKAAADIGTAADLYIKWELGGKVGPEPSLPDASAIAVMAFEDWVKEAKFEPGESDVFVWSIEADAAGTIDHVGRIGEDQIVVDFKVTKGIWPNHILQVAAYRHMYADTVPLWEVERDGLIQGPVFPGQLIPVCDLLGVRTTRIEPKAAIIRLPKTLEDPAFEVRYVDPKDYERLWTAFLACRKVWEFLMQEKANGAR